MRLVGQGIAYAVFAALVGMFSIWPAFRLLGEEQAIVSLSFAHAGQRTGECRQLTQEELNELPPNMRRPAECPRARHPVRVVFKAGDEVLYDEVLRPSGLWEDGKSTVYRRLVIPAGHHELWIGMDDSGGSGANDYEARVSVAIDPGQNFVVGFDETSQSFVFEQGRP